MGNFSWLNDQVLRMEWLSTSVRLLVETVFHFSLMKN